MIQYSIAVPNKPGISMNEGDQTGDPDRFNLELKDLLKQLKFYSIYIKPMLFTCGPNFLARSELEMGGLPVGRLICGSSYMG